MTAETVFLSEVRKVARDDGMTTGETDRLLVLQAIDVAIPRTDPAGRSIATPRSTRCSNSPLR
jgi:hypothetical protein